MPTNKAKILVVDTQPVRLKELEASLSPQHIVVGTTQLDCAVALLHAHRDVTTILVSTGKGVDVLDVLQSAMRQRPEVLRVLITGFEDLSVVVEGLHSGAVQRVVSRPIAHAELLGVVRLPEDGGYLARSA